MIRQFKPDDTDALVAIWSAANALAHPFLTPTFTAQIAQDIRNIYLPNAETWVLEQAGWPIGFIAMLGSEIGGLFLDPACHGKGHGRAMVDHAVGLHGPLQVEVFRDNALGRSFYERYGFVLVEEYLHDPSGQVTCKMAMPA